MTAPSGSPGRHVHPRTRTNPSVRRIDLLITKKARRDVGPVATVALRLLDRHKHGTWKPDAVRTADYRALRPGTEA
jgi:hypothetical protein